MRCAAGQPPGTWFSVLSLVLYFFRAGAAFSLRCGLSCRGCTPYEQVWVGRMRPPYPVWSALPQAALSPTNVLERMRSHASPSAWYIPGMCWAGPTQVENMLALI
jgi:hypothetical protein